MQELMSPVHDAARTAGRFPSALRRLGSRHRAPLTDAARARADRRWGLAGLVGVVVLAAGFGLVHVSDFDVHTHTAYLTDAGSVRIGDPVRVAGVTVGEVKSLAAHGDRVEMRFTVAEDVILGAQTTLAVRMLTIVGGHYLAVIPVGSEPLGGKPIPADRVLLPYSLPKVFQEAIRPVGQIDGAVLRQNVAALESAVSKNPQAIGTTLTAVGTIVDIMNRQNADISRSLKLADEYVNALDGGKQVLITLVQNFRILETLVENHTLEVNQAMTVLARTLDRSAPLAQAWDSTLAPMAGPLADSLPKLDEIGTKLQALLDSLRGIGAQLQPLVSAQGLSLDQSATTLTGTDICVPVPGRVC
ncbi:phospholipid/cholesterol/gamma-HCH transport system substrate-binding protein [Nocardia tenerifensis]|uniref:Phospholipid/cholesterol/gamma-HCH transport system substrate-binding protein n=1 Tax=Nocardia tenerifensis TaxID=228006 RepID=A0A318JRL0_9NOCA|nr:MlaD family protein [Nocardia tenerifensis]PXX58456.1 phospholipid/cholesterol/gamma-HCH transport system substrate-binding protein [Nocardia tenerifensis]